MLNMKRLEKRVTAILLTLVLLLGVIGCGQNTNTDNSSGSQEGNSGQNTNADNSGNSQEGNSETSALDPVTLKFYFIGEPATDNEEVFNEINRILTEKINATIEPVYLSWGDWDQRYPLLFTSGEEFDMIYTAGLGIIF